MEFDLLHTAPVLLLLQQISIAWQGKAKQLRQDRPHRLASFANHQRVRRPRRKFSWLMVFCADRDLLLPKTVKVVSGALAAALVMGTTSRAAADAKRLATFTEGPAPRLELDQSPLVPGALELEVRFLGARPLCYSYSVVLSHGTPQRAPAPAEPRQAEWFPQPGPATEAIDLGGADGARTMLGEARQALERALVEARSQASLESVWAECDANAGNPDAQRWRVETIARIVAIKAGPGGTWRRAVERSFAVARAVRNMMDRMQSQPELERELAQRAQAAAQAERDEREASAQVAAAAKAGRKPTPEVASRHERAKAALSQANLALEETRKHLADRARSQGLAEAAYGFEEQTRMAARSLGQIVHEVERARALLARSPSGFLRHVAPGREIVLSVVRTRLRRGLAAPGDPGEAFESPTIETLSPILFDVGVGPGLTLRRTEAYGLGVAPLERPGEPPGPVATRVIRTEEAINVDGVVSLSAYIWGRRYLDETILDARQLLPRPMLGLSMRDPFSSIYVGGQIDPVQFVDVSFGARWHTRERLIGPALGQPALLDENGNPAEPVTQDEYVVSPFVAVTFSTDLLHRWIRRGF